MPLIGLYISTNSIVVLLDALLTSWSLCRPGENINVSPSRLEHESAGLSISPRLLNLVRGGEGLLRLSNRGGATLSWELPEPPAAIQVLFLFL